MDEMEKFVGGEGVSEKMEIIFQEEKMLKLWLSIYFQTPITTDTALTQLDLEMQDAKNNNPA